jgi:predicted nucleotidyltransferase
MTEALKEQNRKIVLELKRRLSADLQKRVIKLILYGSRARGIYAEDSDLDLVALVDEKTPEIESALDDLAYGVMNVILQAHRKRRHSHMTDEVKRYLRKAEHALEVAEDLLKDGHVTDAASKTYYAMYYAAQTLLNADGIDVVKHSAVEAAFGYHFAKTGKIDPNSIGCS